MVIIFAAQMAHYASSGFSTQKFVPEFKRLNPFQKIKRHSQTEVWLR